MQHRLFTLLLFSGVLHLVQSLSPTYSLIQEGRTWSDAQAYCRAKYIDLAIIKSPEDMTNLQNAAQTQQFSSNAWIGLYTNISNWYWTFNNESLGSFTSWDVMQQYNTVGDELCVLITHWLWKAVPCTWSFESVCFDDRENATERYVLITRRTTWFDAQSYCRQHHTDLASARNETENSVVGSKNGWAWTWIGLRRDKYPWKWTDQTTDVSAINLLFVYTNLVQNELCICLNGGMANVDQCSTTLPFFCYSYPKKQQIIRMKVKSSQDVNVPTMMAALEEKIKEKLKDYGMNGNITVTWRKQPDGVVFHKEEENITALSNTGDTSGP